jgi:hypothetical protein
MTGDQAILLPSIAMALLTLSLILFMGLHRVHAVRRRRVHIRFFRTFRGDEMPEDLHIVHRHVHNHFELPPLFHVAIVATYAAGAVTPLAVTLGWAFLATRCVHTLIHLTYNNVNHRFLAYGAGLMIVAALWIHLLVALLDG